MSNLNKETIEKIKGKAKDYALNLTFPFTWSSERVEGARDDAANDYEAAATEWAGKAQPAIDALDELLKQLPEGNTLNYYFAKEQVIKAREELAKYKEVENGKA